MKRLAALCFFYAAALSAQDSDPLGQALYALDQFVEAQNMLERVESAPDRVKALTEVVQAYETSLTAMRGGLRDLAVREAELEVVFEAQNQDLSQLMGSLVAFSPNASPAALLHPNGPLGHARAGMLVSHVTPELQNEVARVKQNLSDISETRALQAQALSAIEEGLSDAQGARTKLSQAIAARTDLPRRFDSNPELMADMLNIIESMEDFAAGLAVMDTFNNIAPLTEPAQTAWALPTQAQVLRGFNEADAAGVTRPGWVLATPPLALATAPQAATIRYLGPFLDYGNVIILEPADDILLVLAGFETVYGSVGEIVTKGAPIGVMGGQPPRVEDFAENTAGGAGARLSETLYIEVRETGKAVDPALWFTQ